MPNHPNSIATFKNAFDGGTRPNRFVVTGIIGGDEQNDVPPLLVKAASMPVQTLGVMQVPFRGRVAKLPGDRAYAEWTFTLLDEAKAGANTIDNQSGGNVRRLFERWHESFNMHRDNIAGNNGDETILNGTNPDYYTTWTVNQLNMAGEEIVGRAVRLHYCWPTEVGAIDLSYDSADTLTEYSVTLAFDYLTLQDTTGVASANIGAGIGTDVGFSIPE
jgi:hypothetical protein